MHQHFKELMRDLRTVKKAIQNINFQRKIRSDKSKFMYSPRDIRRIIMATKKLPLNSSKAIFEEARVVHASHDTQCRVLKKIATVNKPKAKSPLSQINKNKIVAWAKKYMKANFSDVIMFDECRATLNGRNGW